MVPFYNCDPYMTIKYFNTRLQKNILKVSQKVTIDLLVLILLAKSSDPWGVGRVRKGSENAFCLRTFVAKQAKNHISATIDHFFATPNPILRTLPNPCDPSGFAVL